MAHPFVIPLNLRKHHRIGLPVCQDHRFEGAVVQGDIGFKADKDEPARAFHQILHLVEDGFARGLILFDEAFLIQTRFRSAFPESHFGRGISTIVMPG